MVKNVLKILFFNREGIFGQALYFCVTLVPDLLFSWLKMFKNSSFFNRAGIFGQALYFCVTLVPDLLFSWLKLF